MLQAWAHPLSRLWKLAKLHAHPAPPTVLAPANFQKMYVWLWFRNFSAEWFLNWSWVVIYNLFCAVKNNSLAQLWYVAGFDCFFSIQYSIQYVILVLWWLIFVMLLLSSFDSCNSVITQFHVLQILKFSIAIRILLIQIYTRFFIVFALVFGKLHIGIQKGKKHQKEQKIFC
jgi:hypothetical protein